MDIKEHVQYDRKSDQIIGFENFGDENVSNQLANKAIVFMCHGICRKWKQPIAYYFSSNGCRSSELKKLLLKVLKAAIEEGGLNILATVCDMSTANVKTMKELNSCMDRPYIMLNSQKIYTIFDPPHLLKCTASLFRKHTVLLPVEINEKILIMEAKFIDIRLAHEIDKRSPLIFRALHKIKDSHLNPIMKYSMKVNLAAQVMSQTVASFLYTLLSRGKKRLHNLFICVILLFL
ncbi:hypothetical protein ABEB36_009306 [Hypothenemus hampei]|uniref:Transposable element P transposase n=1 Tax=Hypothenemus hampei TaxID=57062 RepID=A0ABD1EGF9_HYPHA